LFSIITSALSLSIPNIEHYVTSQLDEKKDKNEETFGLKSILENIGIFLPASLFKLFAVSIIVVFFKDNFILNMLYCLVLMFCSAITAYFYNLGKENDVLGQLFDCGGLSWLTITNLDRGKAAALFRLVSTLFWTISYTIILLVILGICDTDPTNVSIDDKGVSDFYWSELALVQHITTLNILLISTICLGWGSMVLDVITAAVKYKFCGHRDNNTEDQGVEVSFWDYAILLEGLKYSRDHTIKETFSLLMSSISAGVQQCVGRLRHYRNPEVVTSSSSSHHAEEEEQSTL